MENQPTAFIFAYPCTLVLNHQKITYYILKANVNQSLNQAHTHWVFLCELQSCALCREVSRRRPFANIPSLLPVLEAFTGLVCMICKH